MTRTLRTTQYALLFFLVLATLLTIPVAAQGRVPTDDEVNAIAKQLYCPVCENVPLDACGTQACIQWRDLIRLKLSQGESEEQIKQYFVDNYGARVLNEPPREGLNWLAYIVPPLAILAGAAFLIRALGRMKRPAAAAPAQGDALNQSKGDALSQSKGPRAEAPADDYVARLEEEVRKRNQEA